MHACVDTDTDWTDVSPCQLDLEVDTKDLKSGQDLCMQALVGVKPRGAGE